MRPSSFLYHLTSTWAIYMSFHSTAPRGSRGYFEAVARRRPGASLLLIHPPWVSGQGRGRREVLPSSRRIFDYLTTVGPSTPARGLGM